MNKILLAALFLVVTTIAAPPSADQLLADARKQAEKEKKAVFVHFGASWCGWCKRLDAFLEDKDAKPVFEKYFVPVKLVVSENEKNKVLENAGSEAALKQLGGPAGLPFHAFLNGQGKLIVNSNRNGEEGQNVGFPASPEEIEWFITMMKKASPNISAQDLKTLEERLKAQRKSARLEVARREL